MNKTRHQLERCKYWEEQAANGLSQEELISRLKEEEIPINFVIYSLSNAYGMSVGDAKDALAKDPSYKKTVEANRPLHEEISILLESRELPLSKKDEST